MRAMGGGAGDAAHGRAIHLHDANHAAAASPKLIENLPVVRPRP